MHIPDGFVSGEAAVAGAAVAAAGLAVCVGRVEREGRERDLPIAGLAAAFFLVGDAPMFPVTVGTQGHLLGGALAVCLLGPWLGAITIAVVAAVQALALGDGGVSTLGLTIVTLALVPAFAGYPLALALRRLLGRTPRGLAVACGIAAAVAVELSALTFVGVFALGAAVPIDLTKIAWSTLGAYAVIGLVEGTLTALIVRALLAVRPDLVRIAAPLQARRGRVSFVGAGPGAPDLLTLRAVEVLGAADVVVWARSLVDPAILTHARRGAELVTSDDKTHDDVVAIYARAAEQRLHVARVHSGDPTIYGTLHEQLAACRALRLDTEIVPGVSSVAAAAAALGQELTVPDVNQTLIWTRRPTRTSMPPNEDLVALAGHGTTLVLFLSVRRPRELQQDLLDGGYAPDTPCAVVYRASWPDEIVIRCALQDLAARIKADKITTQALVLVGPALGDAAGAGRSHVYDPGYGHRFRPLGRPDRYRVRG
jgi:precorrin-4 C11-methyltransferase/cobalamin biosynthesis protein CbiM